MDRRLIDIKVPEGLNSGLAGHAFYISAVMKYL